MIREVEEVVELVEALEPKLAEQHRAMMQRATEPMRQAVQGLIQNLKRSQVAKAIQAGQEVPDFELNDAATGKPVRLSQIVAKGPAVLSFYRGQWFPYCNIEVRGLEQIHGELQELGASIFLVGPETEENAQKLAQETGSTIPILTDADGAVMETFGLAFELPEAMRPAYQQMGNDLPTFNPATGWKLPIPATYVIDRERRAHQVYVNANYTQRMEPADILHAVKEALA